MIGPAAVRRGRRFALLLAALAGIGLPGWLGGAAWLNQSAVALPELVVAAEAAAEAVDAVALTVSDLDRSIAFYTSVLDFRVVGRNVIEGPEIARLHGLPQAKLRVAELTLGEERIRLMQWEPSGRSAPDGGRGDDLWFQHIAIIVRDMDRAYAILQANGVVGISASPQLLPAWNPNAGGIRAYYFRDPDGHPLEILWFPPDKGAAQWHRAGEALFLGIDHTAITVRNTDSSLRFYRDVLGLHVAGESLNYGVEQERLSGVPGARVRITGLRAPAGPGVEFLDYLVPVTGREAPADQRPNDLVHWQTVMAVADLDDVAGRLETNGWSPVSDGIVRIEATAASAWRSLLVRDPDGHFVQLVEASGAPWRLGTQ